MRSKREAVEEIAKSATTRHVADAAKEALRQGTDQAYNRALHETKQNGTTLHVVNIANEQMGYPDNHTSR